jgi:hypothetical protein
MGSGQAGAGATGAGGPAPQGQQQQKQQQEGAAEPPARSAPAQPKPPLQAGRGRLAPLPPPGERAVQGSAGAEAAQRQPSVALRALFPADDAGEGEEGPAGQGAAEAAAHAAREKKGREGAAAQLQQYAQAHPMRPANGGAGRDGAVPGGSPSERAGLERNELAEAWREEFDPGVAAHVVYRLFGEATLPYLPGSPLTAVHL